MSLIQIKYVDELLPMYGCKGVEDTTSLINKSTIVNWDKLHNKLNTEMTTIKNIFPTKSLNLSRINFVIQTEHQAIALLRGLLKIIMIPYEIVRQRNAEYIRLNSKKNIIDYYIIHKQMNTVSLKRIDLNKDYTGRELGIVRNFYVKFGEGVEPKSKFTLVCVSQELCKTRKLEYDEEKSLWKICFFSKYVNMCDMPSEFLTCIFFSLIHYQCFQIFSKQSKCELYIESYDNSETLMSSMYPMLLQETIYSQSLPDDRMLRPLNMLETYVVYADDTFSFMTDNIIRFAGGLIGNAFEYVSRKYKQGQTSIFANGRCGNNYLHHITKYSKKAYPDEY